MYLDKVFIQHQNICTMPKKELVSVFPFLSTRSIVIEKRMQNAIEEALPYYKLKVTFKSSVSF